MARWSGALDAADRLAERALAILADQPRTIVVDALEAEALEAIVAAAHRRPEAGAIDRATRQVVDFAASTGSDGARALALFIQFYVLDQAPSRPEVRELVEQTRELAASTSSPYAVVTTNFVLGSFALASGRLDEAQAHVTASIVASGAVHPDDRPVHVPLAPGAVHRQRGGGGARRRRRGTPAGRSAGAGLVGPARRRRSELVEHARPTTGLWWRRWSANRSGSSTSSAVSPAWWSAALLGAQASICDLVICWALAELGETRRGGRGVGGNGGDRGQRGAGVTADPARHPRGRPAWQRVTRGPSPSSPRHATRPCRPARCGGWPRPSGCSPRRTPSPAIWLRPWCSPPRPR